MFEVATEPALHSSDSLRDFLSLMHQRVISWKVTSCSHSAVISNCSFTCWNTSKNFTNRISWGQANGCADGQYDEVRTTTCWDPNDPGLNSHSAISSLMRQQAPKSSESRCLTWKTGCFPWVVFFFFFFFQGLSPVAASGGHSSSQCAGLSPSRPLLLRSTSSRRAGSVVVAHGPSRSLACGIFPDQGSNPCPLH